MPGLKATPQRVVVLYFSGSLVLWATMLALALAQGSRDPGAMPPEAAWTAALTFAALALHAALIVVAAWASPQWFFGHGPAAVIFCALPLAGLIPAFWIVPVLLYVIGAAYAWEASRRERPGELQASPRLRARNTEPAQSGRGRGHMFG
jgi:hypothetical protein